MTVSNTPLNHVTAHKQYSEMADVPTAGNARVVDAYPTRLAQAPASLTQPRQDGVVKGRALPGPLSEAQLDEFERKGYLFIPNLIVSTTSRALPVKASIGTRTSRPGTLKMVCPTCTRSAPR